MPLPGAENQPDGDASPTTRRHRGYVGDHGAMLGRGFVETMGVFGDHYLFETQGPRQGALLQVVAMSSGGQKQSFEQLLYQLTLFI